MKTFMIFCSLIALTLGEIVASNKYDLDFKENLQFIQHRHHTQHEQSVNAARQKLQDTLSKLETQTNYAGSSYGNSYGSSGSQKYVAGCSTCYGGSENRASYTSRQSSSSSSQQRNVQGVDSDYNGIGIVGHSSDARYLANGDDDLQSLVGPSYASNSMSSRFSSHSAHEADDMQQRVVPGDLSSVQSSAYRSRGSEHDEEDVQQTVSPTARPAYTSVYRPRSDSERSESSRTESRSESSRTEQRSEASRIGSAYNSDGSLTSTQNRGSGQVINLAVRPGTSTVLAVPVRVIQTTGTADDQQNVYSRNSEYSSGHDSSSNTRYPSSTTYRVVYTPTRNSVSQDKISTSYQSETAGSRTAGGTQQPEKLINYHSYAPGSSSQSRFNAEERNSETQTRVSPSYPSNGGSSRVAYGSTQGGITTQQRVVPVAPINTIESVSSRTAEERDERRYTPSGPTYISATRNSNSAVEDSRRESQTGSSRQAYVHPDRYYSSSNQQGASQQGSAGSTYYIPSRTQSQNQAQTQSHQRQSGYTGGRTSNSQNSDYLSQRFGSGVSGISSDDLHAYMSESERLARLQQQQIVSSSSGPLISNSELNRQTIQKASNLDTAAASFIQNSNVGSRFNEFDGHSLNNAGSGSGTGGYNRVTSWNKQSKWSSGSEYGSDGKPKTYSTLSTAEAEKHNINGAEVGYKAATSTLENDGKVSTYSIHT